MQKLQPALRAGQHVDARGERWLVEHAEYFDRVTLLTLRGLGTDNLDETTELLTPFDEVRPVEPITGVRRRPRRDVLDTAVHVILASPGWRECRTAGSARIEVRPWQLQPALAAIDGATRILLADEVGLGKTIQALLIVAELRERALARRVLVLTPASLRDQWQAEMSERFGMRPTVFDQATLAAVIASLPPGVNPWDTAPLIVSSIDLAKRPEVRVALDAVPFDLLVVDEAHHLTPGSDRGAVVADLATRVPWLVCVTATPHSGDERAYRFLRELGNASGCDDMVVYRRRAAQVRTAPRRHVHLLRVATSPAERALLNESMRYAKAVWSGPGQTLGAHLVASTIARRAASSARAAGATLHRRLLLLSGQVASERPLRLPWDEEADDTGVSDDILGSARLGDRRGELEWLTDLVGLAAAAETESSKVACVCRLLRRTHEPLLVFSEYRDVVADLAAMLTPLTTVACLHGEQTAEERRRSIRAFCEGRARVLVATDAAGEGLNLQARCRLVVNIDLPWNPRRLEQRIGRVDRIGQTRAVHVVHLLHPGSFEDTVLGRLEARRARAAVGLQGYGELTEERIAAVVFDAAALDRVEAASPEAGALVHPDLGDAPLCQRRLRGLLTGRGSGVWAQAAVFGASGARATSAVVMLFGSEIVDGGGRLVQREVIPLRVGGVMLRHRRRRLAKTTLRQLVAHPLIRTSLDREMHRRLAMVRHEVGVGAAALERRTSALLDGLRRRQPAAVVQASLFDRRCEQRAQAERSAVARWRARLEQHRAGARALASLSSRTPRLVAAWLAD